MKTKKEMLETVTYWLKVILKSFAKLILKICIVVAIGAALSYALHYFKGFSFGSTMRIIGVVIAMLGLGSQTGATGMRNDYNYNMVKMRDPKMLAREHDGTMMSGSLSFLIWMGSSGIILFVIASYLV